MPNKLPKVFKTISGWRGDSLACPQAFGGDVFQGCSMGCWFCFCRELENRTYGNVYNNWTPGQVRSCDPDDYRRLFDKALGSDKPSKNWSIQCIREGVPFNMGSKAETFCPEDLEYDSVVPVLEVFRDYDYPIIFETKSKLIGLKRYMDLIKEMNAAVIMSIMGGGGKVNYKLEPHIPPPSDRWQLIKQLNSLGIWTAVRWEPVLMGINSTKADFINYAKNCVQSGVKHVSVYNYRSSDYDAATVAFEARGFDFLKLVKRNESDWPKVGALFFDIMKQNKIPCSSPDFVNFGFSSDCVSCCGLDNKFGLKYKLNWMYALRLIKDNGSVRFQELADLKFKNPKSFELMKKSWNGSKSIWTLADSPDIEVIGEEKGFFIYGRKQGAIKAGSFF